MLTEDPTFVSAVHYRDVQGAIAWLERAFGFELTMAIPGPEESPEMGHWEMSCAGHGRIMISAEWDERMKSPASVGGSNTQQVHVTIPGGAAELDAHCETARSNGGEVLMEPEDQFYGDRTYRTLDPEGHIWVFSAHVRDVTRAEAEKAIGVPIESTSWA